MGKLLIICGNVGSGKGTLAKRLLAVPFPTASYFSSDGLREELSGDIGGPSRGINQSGKEFDVFLTMRKLVESAINNNENVIVDSTGMSKAFIAMVNDWRDRFDDITVIRLNCDFDSWKNREGTRIDRWKLDANGIRVPFEMPERAYFTSSVWKFKHPPDIFVNTSKLTPDEVFNEVTSGLSKVNNGIHDFDTSKDTKN
jgi:tRNA uridine 5-carbamoylmethylation protein Kti12